MGDNTCSQPTGEKGENMISEEQIEEQILEGLEQMLEGVDSDISRLTEARGRLYGTIQDIKRGNIQPFTAETGGAVAKREPTYGELFTNAIEGVLTEEQPLHRRVILDRVIEKGIHIGAKKPLNALGQYLRVRTGGLRTSARVCGHWWTTPARTWRLNRRR